MRAAFGSFLGRRILSTVMGLALVAVLLVIGVRAESAPFTSKIFLSVAALPDVSVFSGYHVPGKGKANLWCDIDLTAITGGGSVQAKLIACLPEEMSTSAGCTDETDGVIWALGTSLSAPGVDRIMVLPAATTGEETTMSDVEIVAPILPVFGIHMVETGSTTLTYTVHCAWW